MNVYDTVNKLAQEIRESEEYKNFKKYKETVKSNNEIAENLKKFEELRYGAQITAMQGIKPDPEKVFNLTDEEVPHSVSCITEAVEIGKTSYNIHVSIIVDRDSLKKIIIGKHQRGGCDGHEKNTT